MIQGLGLRIFTAEGPGSVPGQGTEIPQTMQGGGCRGSKKENEGFPGSSVVKSLPANAGDVGLIPGLGRSHVSQST